MKSAHSSKGGEYQRLRNARRNTRGYQKKREARREAIGMLDMKKLLCLCAKQSYVPKP